jgi:hypothetical protein
MQQTKLLHLPNHVLHICRIRSLIVESSNLYLPKEFLDDNLEPKPALKTHCIREGPGQLHDILYEKSVGERTSRKTKTPEIREEAP